MFKFASKIKSDSDANLNYFLEISKKLWIKIQLTSRNSTMNLPTARRGASSPGFRSDWKYLSPPQRAASSTTVGEPSRESL